MAEMPAIRFFKKLIPPGQRHTLFERLTLCVPDMGSDKGRYWELVSSMGRASHECRVNRKLSISAI